jgi:Helix-turn-helix domain
MTRQRSTGAAGKVSLHVGQPFNPFGLFNGIFIPEALMRAKGISLGAKVTYGRLARYAGQDGNCYPSVPTLAAELATSARQTQRYLAELEGNELIRRIPRISESGQTSSTYVFLWHPLFVEGMTDPAPEGVTDPTPERVTDPTPKESHSEESPIEETNIDLDSPSANRKNGDSRVDSSDVASTCKQYPRVREALAEYMTTVDDDERVYPPDRLVVDVMDASAGATEEEVIRCLYYLRNERRLRPGARHGPRHFGWFKTVVGDYFRQKSFREAVVTPPNVDDQKNGAGLSKAEFDSMTDSIETCGS